MSAEHIIALICAIALVGILVLIISTLSGINQLNADEEEK